ncbi:MAG: hypothetical protein EKK53_26645 [Burkholderiales bacterium]|nr:MAG: hypothetical protein EKK53_26645 [Burkholderiales bacterium]
MIYVYSRRDFVATINKQHPAAPGHRAEEPWLLLHNTGRVDRFETAGEARREAQKSYVDVSFKKG